MQAPRQAPAEQNRFGAWGHARLALLPLPSATALLKQPTGLAPSLFDLRTEGPLGCALARALPNWHMRPAAALSGALGSCMPARGRQGARCNEPRGGRGMHCLAAPAVFLTLMPSPASLCQWLARACPMWGDCFRNSVVNPHDRLRKKPPQRVKTQTAHARRARGPNFHMSKLRTRRPPSRIRPRGTASAERRRLASGYSPASAVSKLRARGRPSKSKIQPRACPHRTTKLFKCGTPQGMGRCSAARGLGQSRSPLIPGTRHSSGFSNRS